MEQKCEIQIGLAQYKNVAMPYKTHPFKWGIILAWMQPRGFIFYSGFYGEVLFKFNLPGVLIEMGF